MSKNKTINQLLSNIVLVGLLFGSLPFGLPLRGQAKKTGDLKQLRQEVGREIRKIKFVVNGLTAATITAPIILAAAGLVVTAVISSLVALLFSLSSSNLKKAINLMQKEWPSSVDALLSIRHRMTQRVYAEATKKIRERFLEFLKKEKEVLKRLIDSPFLRDLKEKIMKHAENFKGVKDKIIKVLESKSLSESLETLDANEVSILIAALEDIKMINDVPHKEILKVVVKKVLKPARNRLIILWGSVGFIGTVLIGLVGTAAGSIGSLFGLSALSVSAAFKAAEKIEQIKKEHPGILTSSQKRVLAQLKKQSKGLMSRSIIEGLRLEAVRTAAADRAISQHPVLVKVLGGQKKAHKIFTKYIKFKRKEKLFEKTLTLSTSKRQLNKTKKKIKKFEKKHSGLKAALENTVQTYIIQADAILGELKEEMMKAAEKGGVKSEKMSRPIVPL